jgi:hypothetical protein
MLLWLLALLQLRRCIVSLATNIIIDRKIEMFNEPDPVAQRYRTERSAGIGDRLSLPGGVALAAADILPRY